MWSKPCEIAHVKDITSCRRRGLSWCGFGHLEKAKLSQNQQFLAPGSCPTKCCRPLCHGEWFLVALENAGTGCREPLRGIYFCVQASSCWRSFCALHEKPHNYTSETYTKWNNSYHQKAIILQTQQNGALKNDIYYQLEEGMYHNHQRVLK